MSSGNGHAVDGVGAGMTMDEKMDALLDGLLEVRELIEYVPEISAQMQELIEQQTEILEKLGELGLVENEGFGVERFN